MSQKKPMLKCLLNQETHQVSSLKRWESQKQWYIDDLVDGINNHIKCQSDKNNTFSVKTIWHCRDLEIRLRSLKLLRTGKAQWLVPSCILTFTTWAVSWQVKRPYSTLITTYTPIFPVSLKTNRKKKKVWVVGWAQMDIHMDKPLVPFIESQRKLVMR